MTATPNSTTRTASQFLILACLYLLLAPVQSPSGQISPANNAQLVDAVSQRFSDVRVLCSSRPELCESAAGFANRVTDNASQRLSRIYDWAVHASTGNSVAIPEGQA
jgi:hypothetical protein